MQIENVNGSNCDTHIFYCLGIIYYAFAIPPTYLLYFSQF